MRTKTTPQADRQSLWDELLRVSGLRRRIGPGSDEKTLIDLQYRCEFEPHGRASETWEEVYQLRFPTIRACWHSMTGWKCTTGTAVMSFRDKTITGVLRKAIAFFHDLESEGLPIPYMESEHVED